MSLDGALIAYAVRYDGLTRLQQSGISTDHFTPEFRTVWRHILRMKRDHDAVPSEDTLRARFPDMDDLPRIRRAELPMLLTQARQRKRYMDFITTIDTTISQATDPETIDEVIQGLQADLNRLAFSNREQHHLVDMFAPEVSRQIKREIRKRRSGMVAGIPSGLKRFDQMAGGLQRQKMITIIGRSGIGKSWLDLLFVASAVINGEKVILYPLEMTLFEVATRLYSIFTCELFGVQKSLRNFDLTTGNVPLRKVQRFLAALEDRFAGQLYVADVSHLADPYTIERVEAEVEVYNPAMFWIDYLTLMKAPTGGRGDEADHVAIRRLSHGVKNVAMRRNVVGGCSAQVNREAMKARKFLPRLEHISYGDSIGQDSDQVFSINRRGSNLYYALVKNRGGPEIGTRHKDGIRVRFNVNEGDISEHEMQDEEEDDE